MTPREASDRGGDDLCPKCAADLSYEHDGKQYSRRIGHVVNDFVRFWECPDCRHTWDRALG